MRCAILGFAAGAAWLQMQAALPQPLTMLACGAIALLLCGLHGCCRAALTGALSGFVWAALLAHTALAPQLAREDEGRDITLIGTVDSLPYRFDGGVRFHFAVEHVAGVQIAVPPRVSLAWYGGGGRGARPARQVQPGERWQLTVRMQRPHGNANPGGFDYEVWLLEQGIRATGYVRIDGASNRLLDPFVYSFANVVQRTRAALRERIERALPGKEYAGVIVALVVGDQRGIALCRYI